MLFQKKKLEFVPVLEWSVAIGLGRIWIMAELNNIVFLAVWTKRFIFASKEKMIDFERKREDMLRKELKNARETR